MRLCDPHRGEAVTRLLGPVAFRGILLPAFLLLWSCGEERTTGASRTLPGPTDKVSLSEVAIRTAGIQVEPVRQERLDRVIELTGTLAAVPWTPEEQAVISEAEAADSRLRLAESRFARLTKLAGEGIVPQQDLDVARAEFDQAKAGEALSGAKRANLGLSMEKQTFAAKVWGLANLVEADLVSVAAGDKVLVRSESVPGLQFPGKVVAVSRAADSQTRGFTVRIAIEDRENRLRPQALATFELSSPGRSRPTVPSSAVLLQGDGSYVYLAEGRTFRKTQIRAGPASGGRVPVLEGLSGGEVVVTNGAQILESERLKSGIVQKDD